MHPTSISLLSVLHRPTSPLPTGRWRPQYAEGAARIHPPATPPTPPLREGQLSPAPAIRLTSYHAWYQTPPAARGREETYKKTAIRSSTRLPRPHPATGEVDPHEHASSPFRSAVGPLLSSETEPRRDPPDPTLSNRVGYCPKRKPHPHGAICAHRPNILPRSRTFHPPMLKRKTKPLVPATATALRVPADDTMTHPQGARSTLQVYVYATWSRPLRENE